MIYYRTVLGLNDTLEQNKYSILCLFAFDNDWNGNNGVEYLLPEAYKFKSNNEYFVETQSHLLHPLTVESLSLVIKSYFELNNYYK